ncbi:helix-turn-helix domain-containing protein [Salinithrix halophila]|uniref:Helix-turn-helix domain-containing protein n=1 Tax=Salinithrix halophila TaxID=1485204 RepID=A0ABV8JA89_9BACL
MLRIHILMAEKRMTQKELADKTGIRANTISSYFNDSWKTVKREHLKAFSKVFDCSIRDLWEA